MMKLLFLFVLLVWNKTGAQEGIVDFESDRWDKSGGEIVEHMGRKCMVGAAFLKDVEFQDGIIEVDLAVDGSRSYPGIVFRKYSDRDYEHFYVRPHRSDLYTDVLQYTPVFNGISEWQLYSGEGFTAGAAIPDDRWIHIRLEVCGKQARVFLDDAESPALRIDDLQHPTCKGSIGLTGSAPGVAYFSNFEYRIDENLDFEPPPDVVSPIGMINKWELSQPFKAGKIDLESLPYDQELDSLNWQEVQSQPSGLVDVARYTGRIGRATDCVFARTTIQSDKEQRRSFLFGYSDAISIFLNGDMIFWGSSAYRQRDPSFLGIIGLNDAVYLPLRQGDNELMLIVAESFGGWGFMVQDGEAIFKHDGLTKLWEIPWKLCFPEAVVYDRKRDRLYVSNYFNEGQEFISRISLSGEIEELEWVVGLNRPTGLYIYEDTLYAIDRANLVKIDIDLGAVVDRYPVPDAGFINDLAFDSLGNVYVSDSGGNVIHRYCNGQFERWMEGEEISDPNGLLVDGNRLIFGNSGDGSLKAVDLLDRSVETIVSLGRGSVIDGVKADGKGNYIISDFNGRIFLVSKAGERTELLNTTASQYFCADFEYIPESGLLIIPTLFDNRIMAYRLEL